MPLEAEGLELAGSNPGTSRPTVLFNSLGRHPGSVKAVRAEGLELAGSNPGVTIALLGQ
jgi:hypothetical protein